MSSNLDDILNMWELDSNIDEGNIGAAAIETAKLHAKYIRFLSNAKMKQVKYEADVAQLRQLKFRYFRGELTREELSDLGWDQWRYAKPLKTEMAELLDGDKDMLNLSLKMEYNKTVIGALESIIKEINQRSFHIRNWVEYRKFVNA